MDVEVGDWVAFMSDGQIVYGKVEYLWYKQSRLLEVYTTAGMTYRESILEVRRAGDRGGETVV